MTVQHPDGAVRPEGGEVSGEPVTPAPRRVAFTITSIGQLGVLLALTLTAGAVAGWGFTWITSAENPIPGYLAALLWTALVLAGWELTAIIGKWLLIGRARPGALDLWGFHHFRFWAATRLVRGAPAARLVGSEWQRWHLNASGARIGRGTVLLCATPPVPDLIEIGPHSLVGERTLLSGYRHADGALILDRVQLGAGTVVGDDCVLEPGSSLGDHARLAGSASVQPGQSVPSGQSWHGSPARPVDAELPNQPQLIAEPRLGPPVRRVGHAITQLIAWVAVLAGAADAIAWLGRYLLTELFPAAVDGSAFGLPIALGWSLALAGAMLVLALVIMVVLSVAPRALAGMFEDGRVFPLPSFRWTLVRMVRATSNLPWFSTLFNGSALATRRLRLLGWRLRQRPGSIEAFGEDVGQANPLAITWGAGSTAGDRLWIANLECSADAFRLAPARIGADCSLGDEVSWPSAARLGDGCQVAPRTAVPVSGPLRIRVSLSGSPAVESEREPSERSEWGRSLPELYRQLGDRARADVVTIGLQLLVGWCWLSLAVLEIQLLVTAGLPSWLVGFGIVMGATLIRWACWLGVEAIARSVTPARPVTFAVRDPRFSRHHRVRSLGLEPPKLLAGTALRAGWWRLRGAEVGRCVFDDGATMSEPSLVRIGDQVQLGQGASLQSHETKDAVYSLAEITVADRTVLGAHVLLVAGTELGRDTHVAADSVLFAAVGPAGSSWLGNPARMSLAPADGPTAGPKRAPVPPPDLRPTAGPPSARAVQESPAATPVTAQTLAPATVMSPPPAPSAVASPATPTTPAQPPAPAPKPPRIGKRQHPTPESSEPSTPPTAGTPLPPEPHIVPTPSVGQHFTLLGTNFGAERIAVPELAATIAVLDLSDTPLIDLNLPQTLAGFGIPEECLEDDLSLRDAPISSSAEIRSLLARVLLRQLLSTAHSEYQPEEWGFIRASSGGLRPFWPTTDEAISIGRSDAAVVAAIAPRPIGVSVLAEFGDPSREPASVEALTQHEWEWLTHGQHSSSGTSLTRIAAAKSAAIKAVSELGQAKATELDTITTQDAVHWRRPDGPELVLPCMVWPRRVGRVQHWIAVVGSVDSGLGEDDARGVVHDGWL